MLPCHDWHGEQSARVFGESAFLATAPARSCGKYLREGLDTEGMGTRGVLLCLCFGGAKGRMKGDIMQTKSRGRQIGMRKGEREAGVYN